MKTKQNKNPKNKRETKLSKPLDSDCKIGCQRDEKLKSNGERYLMEKYWYFGGGCSMVTQLKRTS